MSNYFTNFPTTQYDLFFDNQTSEVIDIFRIVKVKKRYKDDITFYTYYTIQDGERPDVVSTKLYGVPSYYWTFFMVNDNLVNVHTDWPLSTSDLQTLIDKKYAGTVLTTHEDISSKFVKNNIVTGLVSGARAKLLDKDPNLGIIKIQLISGEFVPNEIVRDTLTNEFAVITGQAAFKDVVHHFENAKGDYVTKQTIGATPISNQEHEFVLNDTKSQIKIIRQQYIQNIADQFINQIKTEEA
jgi:hypothetical protein